MTEPWELPDGWEWANFQEVAQIASDLVSPADHQDEPHIAPNHIESGSGRLLPYTTIAADKVTSPKHRFRPGQILYSKIRPYLCKAVRVDFAGLCSADMYPITAKIDAGYLHRWMLSLTFTEWASGAQGRTVLPKINQEALSIIQVPVPPLVEQRRIVAKIEELTARSRAARAALAEVPTLLEQFRQSVLASAFRGDLTADWRAKNPVAEPASVLLERIRDERRKQWEAKYPKRKYVAPEPVDDADLSELPEGWCWAAAEEIVDPACSIVYGIVQPGPPLDEGVPYVRGLDIQDGIIRTEQLWKTSTEIAAQYSKSRLQAGDILLGIIRHTKVAIVPESLTGGNMGRATALLRPGSAITSSFLASYLESPIGQTWLLENQQGSDMPVLNLKELWRLPVPIAPLAEQVEVVSVLKQRFVPLQKITEDVDDAVAHAELIDQSILAKAFRGELVPQDPADEPAAALLARIRLLRSSF